MKYTPIIWPSHSTPRYLPRRKESVSVLRGCTPVFVAAAFVMAQHGKYHQCHRRRVGTLWHIHRMENSSMIKRNELLIHKIVWMNPKIIMLNERSHASEKGACCMIPHCFMDNDRKEITYCLGREGRGLQRAQEKLGHGVVHTHCLGSSDLYRGVYIYPSLPKRALYICATYFMLVILSKTVLKEG